MLGCCNLEGDTATGNPVSLRSCPFNGNHMLLFKIGCDFLCSGGTPLCVDVVLHIITCFFGFFVVNKQLNVLHEHDFLNLFLGVNESPFMTWGEIESTPLRLEGSDTPYVDRTPGPAFKVFYVRSQLVILFLGGKN